MGAPVTDTTMIRDALYDRIAIDARERAIIGTSPFLRLDRVQQLGFVSRVWPGAKHTRYEHSLGVLHLTRRAITSLRHRHADLFTDDDARAIVAASLLHDIGHYPFSHAIEELGPPVLSHEEVGRRIITRDPVAGLLERHWGLDPDRVANLVVGALDHASPADRLLYGLLSGTLDVDKLDYLPRDAHACSVPYGGVDVERLLDALTVITLPGQRAQPRIAIVEKGISPLHSLINARQEMFDNVYWHHTNRACMIMLLRAVQEALAAQVIVPEHLTDHDDASLLALMQQPSMPEPTRRLATALAERRIHKRAVEISARASDLYDRLSTLWYDREARRRVERSLCAALAERTGQPVAETAILIDIPKPERWKTEAWVSFARPPVGLQPLMHWRDVVGMADEDFKRYEEHRRLIRIVAEEPLREALRSEWEAILYPALGGMA